MLLKPVQPLRKFPPFIEGIVVAYYQALEAFKQERLKGVLRPRFFWKRKATPVVMDLSVVVLPADIRSTFGYQFDELNMGNLVEEKLLFLVPSRGVKALRNLKRGWRGFALIQGNIVVGDLWCVVPSADGTRAAHPDLAMLGITCGAKDAYAFDMYISPAYRGENLAAPFQRSLQAVLKAEGWNKVYGYYWDDNLPALWMHRILKFKELPKRQVSRLLFYQKADPFVKPSRSA
jgi:GNAT superfamily N-acetyltransferase